MATARADMKGYFKQKKKGSTAGISKPTSKGGKSTAKKTPSPSASVGSDVAQPPALVSHHGSLDLQDEHDAKEELLRQFDMNMAYGPCIGMSRLERWNRAYKLGLNPPKVVEDLLKADKRPRFNPPSSLAVPGSATYNTSRCCGCGCKLS